MYNKGFKVSLPWHLWTHISNNYELKLTRNYYLPLNFLIAPSPENSLATAKVNQLFRNNLSSFVSKKSPKLLISGRIEVIICRFTRVKIHPHTLWSGLSSVASKKWVLLMLCWSNLGLGFLFVLRSWRGEMDGLVFAAMAVKLHPVGDEFPQSHRWCCSSIASISRIWYCAKVARWRPCPSSTLYRPYWFESLVSWAPLSIAHYWTGYPDPYWRS